MPRTSKRCKKHSRGMDFVRRKPSEPYMLTCTECYSTFPPRCFKGQLREFRMCEACKKNNPEICQYLDKYFYKPKKMQDQNCGPLQKIVQKCELLKIKLASAKQSNGNKGANETKEIHEARAMLLLQSLIRKCELYEMSNNAKQDLTE